MCLLITSLGEREFTHRIFLRWIYCFLNWDDDALKSFIVVARLVCLGRMPVVTGPLGLVTQYPDVSSLAWESSFPVMDNYGYLRYPVFVLYDRVNLIGRSWMCPIKEEYFYYVGMYYRYYHCYYVVTYYSWCMARTFQENWRVDHGLNKWGAVELHVSQYTKGLRGVSRVKKEKIGEKNASDRTKRG